MKNILLINNDVDTMSLLKCWLERKSYKVKYTDSKEEVPEIIKEFVPHLVIVDVLQKDVLRNLKTYKETTSVPLLLMTGYTRRLEDDQLPVDDTIEKPFNLPLLENKIE